MPEQTSPTKLLILGAGCSKPYGYPLAPETRPQLEAFSREIEPSAPKLYKLVLQTLEIFNKLNAVGSPATTLDDLSWLLYQGKLHDRSNPNGQIEAYRLTEQAKLAVAAMFLSKERAAVATGLVAYRTLLRRIFGDELYCYRALTSSPWRVLTFNYDRLFELAFRQHFDWDGQYGFYGAMGLNSGVMLADPLRIQVDLNRFSLLKLHGSVGFYSYEQYGDCEHRHTEPNPAAAAQITDETFFVPDSRGIHSNQPRPSLIVFPHEKRLVQGNDTRFPYSKYIPEVWKAAHHFAGQAEEIWIAGYSCPEPDFNALTSLLKSAANCKRVIIWNPSAQNICRRMKLRVPEIANLFVPHEETFEAG